MRKRPASLFKKVLYERYRLNEEEKEDDAGDLFGGDDAEEGGDEKDDAEADAGGGDAPEDDAGSDDPEGEDEGEGDEKASGDEKDPGKDLSDEEKEDIARDWAASKAMENGGTDDGDAPDPDVLTSEIEKHLERALKAAEQTAKMDLAKRVNFLSDRDGPGTVGEGWWRRGLSRLIFEDKAAGDPVFDVGEYAQHVSRFIFNYDKMLDIPFIIYNKAYDYIKSLYGETIAEQFKNTMEEQYDISFDEKEEAPTVYAVGARPSGASA